MLRKQSHQIEWLEFELFADLPYVKHAIFLRHGGISQGPYSSLNLGMHAQDDPKTVTANLESIKAVFRNMDPSLNQLTWAKGCHGTSIAEVTAASPREVIDHDALVTTSPHHLLMTTHADCQIGLIVDPVRKVVANIHSGWRGNRADIYGKTVDYMKERYLSNPADLLMGIGPSLGPECSEFIHYKTEWPESFWKYLIKPNHLDLWKIAEDQCLGAGILPHHLEVAKICTYCHPEDYFSYRKKPITGRHGACIMLV